VGITTAIVEMVIMPNIDVVRRGILIGFVAKLDNGLGGVSTGRNLSQNSALPMATTRIIGTPKMVFTDLIMIIHVNKL
jgi:hypothetical protein